MIRNQTFNLAAGGTDSISIHGNYVYWDTATGADQQLRIRTGAYGNELVLRPGMDVEFDTLQDRLYIANDGATPLSGVLIVGVGKVTNRLLSGSVNVGNLPADQLVHFGTPQHVITDNTPVNAAHIAARAGKYFAVDTGAANIPNTQAVHVALYNPVGSGVKVYLDVFAVDANAANSWTLAKFEFSAAPAGFGLVAAGDAVLTAVSAAKYWSSGATASAGNVALAAAGFTVTAGFSTIHGISGPALSRTEDVQGRIVLRPGQGLLASAFAIGGITTAIFNFREWEE